MTHELAIAINFSEEKSIQALLQISSTASFSDAFRCRQRKQFGDETHRNCRGTRSDAGLKLFSFRQNNREMTARVASAAASLRSRERTAIDRVKRSR